MMDSMENNEEKKASIKKQQDDALFVLSLSISKVDKRTTSALKGNKALDNSIFYSSTRHYSELEEAFLECFLERSLSLFNMHNHNCERTICNTEHPPILVKQELKNLNQFFETGEYEDEGCSYSGIPTGDVYALHKARIYSNKITVINEKYQNEFKAVLNDGIPSSKSMMQALRGSNLPSSYKASSPLDFIKENKKNIDKVVSLEWYLAIELQILLWLRDRLDALDKSKDFNEIFSRQKKVIPSELANTDNQKKGFKVKNQPQIIPALHQALIDNNLIANIQEDSFEKAFVDGKGSIIWLSRNTTHGKNVSGLSYFLLTMHKDNIITGTQIGVCRIGASVFRYQNGDTPSAKSLNNSCPPKNANAKVIEEIVSNLNNID